MEPFIDYDSDDCSSKGCTDEFEEEGKEEVNVRENVESSKVENIVELSATNFLNKEFESDEKAYELYVKYAKCVGFGVWKGDVSRDGNGNLIG